VAALSAAVIFGDANPSARHLHRPADLHGRGRPHTAAVGALVKEVMAAEWMGKKALARKRAAELPDYSFG
jgi:hypothetical protein